MNRRQFNATVAAALLLPSIRLPRQRVRHIDLSIFCEEEETYRFEMRQPFQQEGLNYATDARVCVRTALPVQMNATEETVRLPKACGLPWKHDEFTGWQPWDKFERVYADSDSCTCPKCFGKGRVGEGIAECATCNGSTVRYEPRLDGDYYEFHCECDAGWMGGAKCGHCNGKGIVDYRILMGGVYLSPEYHAKIATLGDVEFCATRDLFDVKKSGISDVVLFRGNDVEGMVAGMKP